MSNHLAEAVEKNRTLILKALDYIWANPETGYREKKTSRYMEEEFEKLGYTLVRAGDIPGFYTILDTGRPGPEVLVFGEMDSLICENHKESDPETGAVHCCGHAAQCAALLGIAAALKEPSITDALCGRIRLCAVPAEEMIEFEYRDMLRKQGIIKYIGGKPEFMRRGYFEGVDLALMVHTTETEHFEVNVGGVGCLAKRVTYKGVSAHAGGNPWKGRNALYAATLGLQAINSIRETFRERDLIRVHPIITQGGTAVNAIPERVCIESYIRGENFAAISDANRKVNRALCGAALSLGTNVDIQDIPGYAPYRNAPGMIALAKDALAQVMPEQEFVETGVVNTGSTDMGDISCVMPMIHPYAPGATGTSHGDDYMIANPDLACVGSAKWQLAMLTLLLQNGGSRAKEICASYQAPFASQKEYLDYIDTLACEGDRITYREADNVAEVRL